MPGTVLFHTSHLDRDDVLNGTIWSESPKVQPEVQAPDQLQGAGALGTQQAMCDGPVLSWVPDLAWRRWRDPEAVIVVGSAYAGFVREYSSRGCTLPLATYRQARTWQDFQEMFVKEVVRADARYYGPVADLLVEAPQGSFVVLDLCRASSSGAGQPSTLGLTNLETPSYGKGPPVLSDTSSQRYPACGSGRG